MYDVPSTTMPSGARRPWIGPIEVAPQRVPHERAHPAARGEAARRVAVVHPAQRLEHVVRADLLREVEVRLAKEAKEAVPGDVRAEPVLEGPRREAQVVVRFEVL